MKKIKAQVFISDYKLSVFAQELQDHIERTQQDDLEVEVQYQVYNSTTYSALILGRTE